MCNFHITDKKLRDDPLFLGLIKTTLLFLLVSVSIPLLLDNVNKDVKNSKEDDLCSTENVVNTILEEYKHFKNYKKCFLECIDDEKDLEIVNLRTMDKQEDECKSCSKMQININNVF